MADLVISDRLVKQAWRGYEDDVEDGIDGLVTAIMAQVLRVVGVGGGASRAREAGVAAGEAVERFFSGERGSVFGADGVSPLSVYGSILNWWMAWVVWEVGRLVERWVRERVGVLVEGGGLGEGWRGAHEWEDERGYVLGDRIRGVGKRVAGRVEAAVVLGLREGIEAEALERRVRRLLSVRGAAFEGGEVWGRDAAFEAQRLGGYEIGRVFGGAVRLAALSPWGLGVDWVLHPTHPRTDHCDAVATVGMDGGRIGAPYRQGEEPSYPDHPFCRCGLRTVLADGWEDEAPALYGDAGLFSAVVLGPYFAHLASGYLSREPSPA